MKGKKPPKVEVIDEKPTVNANSENANDDDDETEKSIYCHNLQLENDRRKNSKNHNCPLSLLLKLRKNLIGNYFAFIKEANKSMMGILILTKFNSLGSKSSHHC